MSELKLSLTALALGLREAEAVVPLWLDRKDWSAVGQRVLAENLFQKASGTSSRRIFRELRQRLELLEPETLEAFNESGVEEKREILLVAACKCYPFLFEFITGPLRDKLAVFDVRFRTEDFDIFWNDKAVEWEALEKLTESTRKKVRQVLIRLLAEAGLFSSTRFPRITPICLTERMKTVLLREGSPYLSVFLSP